MQQPPVSRLPSPVHLAEIYPPGCVFVGYRELAKTTDIHMHTIYESYVHDVCMYVLVCCIIL